MQEVTRRRAIALGLRARVPVITRLVAFALLVSGIAVVGISYYKLRNADKFKARSEQPELSKEVTGVVEGYERRVTKNDRLYLLVKASRDVTFSDGHHELENINMDVYPPEGDTSDKISAARAIVQPDSNVLSFMGNVKIETKEKLKVNTDALSFDQNSGIAQTDSPVSFERETVSGTAVGAVVEQKAKRLAFKNNVQLTSAPGQSAKTPARARPVSIKAAHALFEQQSLHLTFAGGLTSRQEAHSRRSTSQRACKEPCFVATRTCALWIPDARRKFTPSTWISSWTRTNASSEQWRRTTSPRAPSKGTPPGKSAAATRSKSRFNRRATAVC